ncbi:DUF4013 domain-containing protein [Methanothermococcus okinawensis]|uniref:Glycerophosphoryl diester phosphodiesterase membrane domain-containing protein n=1 Tax=Methanothermococcus okinawensis (strain DSM 14208 / JCM 11175 / IH1) TaxID=647113 RepID=F8AKX6_METOI|nr:DUF4013 domain-containing protein [Methanothermococcus okinawensis]AEH06222.1 hypothetical protein Metok_0229 [Methanothermococcus okinawensis IH1]
MFVDKYIKEPFEYAMSDWKKIFVGGVLGIIGILPFNLFSAVMDGFNHRFGTSAPSISSLTPIIALFIVASLFTIIISIILTGYYIKVSKHTLNSINILPEWENFGALIKDGFIYYIAMLILALIVVGIPVVLMAILFVATGWVSIANPQYLAGMPNSSVIAGIFLFIAILFILFIILAIYTPLATVNFAKKGFEGVFEFKQIFKLMSVKYIILLILLWIIFLIIQIILNLPATILSIWYILSPNFIVLYSSAVLSAIIKGFLSFFLGVVFYKSISNYYVDRINEIISKKEEII